MDSFFLTEDIKNILTAIISGTIGYIGSLLVEVYKKRKYPREIESEVVTKINSAASENIQTAKELVDLLDERLKKEREYFEDQILRSKQSCDEKILELKTNYDKALYDVQIKGEQEKFELMQKIKKLEVDKEDLQTQVTELKDRLKKYESENEESHLRGKK